MNTYLLLQSYVDVQIGGVLATLASKPQVQANTIVVFTSTTASTAARTACAARAHPRMRRRSGSRCRVRPARASRRRGARCRAPSGPRAWTW